ncbi:MAG: MBL fold metallo-hydrolase [Parvibaculum sp.]
MTMRFTILGSGSSGGVPRIGGVWGACDPNEPKNRRRRCSLLVERWEDDPAKKTTVLIDTSPDMREQLIDTGTKWIDGVLFTHDHADQSHGIDDLRMVAINKMRRVDVYMDAYTSETLMTRFGYCFQTPSGSSYPPILNAHLIRPGAPVTIHGEGGPITALPFDQDHGDIRSLGFRFGPVAYSADLVGLPDESFEALSGVDCWIVDALRYKAHPSHAHVDMALSWLERLNVRRGILTNLHVDLDYQTLAQELPDGHEPAYDGMVIEYDE